MSKYEFNLKDSASRTSFTPEEIFSDNQLVQTPEVPTVKLESSNFDEQMKSPLATSSADPNRHQITSSTVEEEPWYLGHQGLKPRTWDKSPNRSFLRNFP